jgi:hypothetical protein
MLNFNLVSLHTISYTVYNCPNTEKYRVNKIHIDPGIFRIRTIVHCSEFILILQPNLISNVFHIRTMNLSWFWIHTTMYLIFQFSMGYGICHGFCLHISPLTPFFFILSQQCKGDNSNWLNKILHWNLLGQYQPIILRDLT